MKHHNISVWLASTSTFKKYDKYQSQSIHSFPSMVFRIFVSPIKDQIVCESISKKFKELNNQSNCLINLKCQFFRLLMMGLAILSDKSIPCVVYEMGECIIPLKNKLFLFLLLEYVLLNCVLKPYQ